MSDNGDEEVCGSTNTTTGDPCQFRPGESCPWHDVEDPPDTGRSRDPPTREQQERIASIIEDGGSIKEACRRAGVHHQTMYRWLEYGDDEDAGPFQEFRDRFVRARGEGEALYRDALIEIAVSNNDTATLMSMLKQRYPDSWGDVNRGEQAGGVTIELGESEEFTVDPETLEVEE